jgi:hypothetical protein
LEPRRRAAISTYLEVFILIGVAVGGSALVYAVTNKYQPVAQGPGIITSQVSIRQGANQAIERLLVGNVGTVTFNSFTVSTTGSAGGIADAQFYVTLTNVAAGASITPSPASGTTGDRVITETATIAPGQSVLATITIVSANEFTVGQSYSIVVSLSGAQVSSQVVVAPA